MANLNKEQLPDLKAGLGQKVDELFEMAATRRARFEKRWYDNNFFDDGYHFRYVSRTTGKIIDAGQKATMNSPIRAVPKASRQIRGIANLLLGAEYTPVIYPEEVSRSSFMATDALGQPVFDEEAYIQAIAESKSIAQKTGHWITEEWKNQELKQKLILMLILAAKHGVSFIQVWGDSVEEKIKTRVYDAFDIYHLGEVTDLEDSPFVGKGVPRPLSEIQADERFDEEQRKRLNPDNKFANSEIKQAYMQSKFGAGNDVDSAASVIQKEIFIKEYLTESNLASIASKFPDVVRGRKVGDMVMRHVFTAGGVWLLDEYIDLPSYPFVTYTYEPGSLYQTPLIERFIPANKTLDILVSRVERWMNTMVAGHWIVRKGEDLQISNLPGGQKIEYKATPPVQGNIAPLPSTVFDFASMLDGYIEEQGASTAALNQLPTGVKSGRAIEEVKATEFANLKIATDQLKLTVKRISEKFLDLGHDYFITPQAVTLLEKGEPTYFSVIGKRGIEAREKAKVEPIVPEAAVVLDKEYRVDIEVETGLGLTEQGKRDSVQQITTFMLSLAQAGYLNPEAVKIMVGKLLETFKFGGTQEIMEALDSTDINDSMTENQIQMIKVALAEVLKDTGVGDPQTQVETTKVGLLEALKDLKGGTK